MLRSATDVVLPQEAVSQGDHVPPAGAGRNKPLRAVVTTDPAGPPLQLFTARGFEWTHAELPIPGLPTELEGFRILHLSDLHARKFWDPAYDDLISRVRAKPPDLIAFTGDFVEDKHDHRKARATVERLINSLVSRLGTVAILGNHDGDLIRPFLSKLNLRMIGRRRLSFQSGDATLELIGIAGVEREDFDPAFLHSLGRKCSGTVRVVLSHYPDLIRKSGFLEPDVFLTGHTHGGQVCLPGGYPIIGHDSLPKRLVRGINRIHNTWLVVNRGLGFSSLPIRMFCPAEVIEISLRKEGGS